MDRDGQMEYAMMELGMSLQKAINDDFCATPSITLDYSDHELAFTLYGEAWCNPETQFTFIPTDVDVAKEWINQNAYMLHFDWGWKPFKEMLAERGAMKYDELISMDEMANLRHRCGWNEFGHNDECEHMICTHPDTAPWTDREHCDCKQGFLCNAFSCPIAYEACVGDIKERDPDFWESDFKDEDEDDPTYDWMILHTRPRYAYVENITVIGCENALT